MACYCAYNRRYLLLACCRRTWFRRGAFRDGRDRYIDPEVHVKCVAGWLPGLTAVLMTLATSIAGRKYRSLHRSCRLPASDMRDCDRLHRMRICQTRIRGTASRRLSIKFIVSTRAIVKHNRSPSLIISPRYDHDMLVLVSYGPGCGALLGLSRV